MNTEKTSLETQNQPSCLGGVSGSLCYSEREIDFAYLAGVFNVSGIDGLQKEIERLKELGKNPHDIIIAAREQ
jgi:antirestriction protein ArdC